MSLNLWAAPPHGTVATCWLLSQHFFCLRQVILWTLTNFSSQSLLPCLIPPPLMPSASVSVRASQIHHSILSLSRVSIILLPFCSMMLYNFQVIGSSGASSSRFTWLIFLPDLFLTAKTWFFIIRTCWRNRCWLLLLQRSLLMSPVEINIPPRSKRNRRGYSNMEIPICHKCGLGSRIHSSSHNGDY